MRTWDIRRDAVSNTWELCVDDDGRDVRLVIAAYQRGIDLQPYLDFIVDACNAYEQRDLDDEPAIRFGPNGEMPTLQAYPLSPRGHAVMEDLAKYEAMHPVHNPPSSPIDEVGDS